MQYTNSALKILQLPSPSSLIAFVGRPIVLPQQVQLPVHTSELITTEIQQQGNINVPNQGITRGDPTSSIQYWGNATMPPHPSLALPSWPVPMQQTQLERTMWDALNPQTSVNPDTMPCSMNMQPPFAPMQQQGPFLWDQLFHQPIPPRSDERFSQQVPMQMMNLQLHTEGYTPNQQARAAKCTTIHSANESTSFSGVYTDGKSATECRRV